MGEVVITPRSGTLPQPPRGAETRVCTSIVVECALRYGVATEGSARLSAQLEQVLRVLPILALETGVDRHYGDIRADLERRGTPIGPNDLLIAAQARALGLILITDNVREFGRVERLGVKNWLGS